MIPDKYIIQHNTIPSQGKLMAIDVGTKRIGIAASCELQVLSTPKMIINRQSNQVDFTKIKDFILENKIKAIIVGYPTHMDGKTNEMSEFCVNFTKNLDIFLTDQGFNLPIIMFDERLSSFEAQEIARSLPNRKKQKHYDDIAARIILDDFLYFRQSQPSKP